MSKRKPEIEETGLVGSIGSGEEGSIHTEEVQAEHFIDHMAKARAARKSGRKSKRPAPVAIGEMEWMLVGFKRDPYRANIIGTAPNRFQLAKKWQAMKDLAFQTYDGVYVVRGKRFDANSL